MPENDRPPDDRLLGELYREQRVGWERLLTNLGLPTNIGIVRSMTVGQAKALAARQAVGGTGDGAQVTSRPVSPRKGSPVTAPSTSPDTGHCLSATDLDSIRAAVKEEIAAAQEMVKTAWIDIDGIAHLADAP